MKHDKSVSVIFIMFVCPHSCKNSRTIGCSWWLSFTKICWYIAFQPCHSWGSQLRSSQNWAKFSTHVSPCDVCGGQSYIGTGFSWEYWSFPLSLSFCDCTVHTHSSITDAEYLQQLTAWLNNTSAWLIPSFTYVFIVANVTCTTLLRWAWKTGSACKNISSRGQESSPWRDKTHMLAHLWWPL